MLGLDIIFFYWIGYVFGLNYIFPLFCQLSVYHFNNLVKRSAFSGSDIKNVIADWLVSFNRQGYYLDHVAHIGEIAILRAVSVNNRRFTPKNIPNELRNYVGV